MKPYSQLRAMFAITKASLRAIFRSPSAVVFGFAFPFIFILVFGFIGDNGGRQSYKVALDNNADTTNELYNALKNTQGITIIRYHDKDSLADDMQRGRLAGIINIQKNSSGNPPYNFTLRSTNSSNDKWPQFKALAEGVINELSNRIYKDRPAYASFNFDYKKDITEIRQYKTIDFILPGQLGFSLLASGVFGVAFMFFNLAQYPGIKKIFCNSYKQDVHYFGRNVQPGFIPDAYGCSNNSCRPFFLWLHFNSWLRNFY